MRCCAGGMQVKSTAFAAGTIDDLRKKGITRNAAGWCPQDSGRKDQMEFNAAEPYLFREDGIIRFPVKARKGCTRQNTDPSSRYGEFPAVCHVSYSTMLFFAGRTVKGGGNQSLIDKAAYATGYADRSRCLSTGRIFLLTE